MGLNSHTVFLLNDGTVRTVGSNSHGQCGTGNTSNEQLSLYKPNIDNVKQISCGSIHTVFLLEDGTVRTVGWNSSGQCSTGDRTSPQLSLYKPNIGNVKQISCGGGHTVFLLNDGTVRTVGDNYYGQCSTGDRTSPQLSLYKPNIENVKQISCGDYHTVFLLEDGTVRTVGQNNYGQCGTGSASTSSPFAQLSLYQVPALTVKSLWDNIDIIIIKYLIKQYNNYYSIKEEYYDNESNQYLPLILEGESIPNKNDIDISGFDNINDIVNEINIEGEIFKPITKLIPNFEIIEYKK